MNLKEAYATLELSEGATPEEAKKRFRKLSKEWHPDVNKSPEAEAKFKKINEAYQCVQSGKGNDRVPIDPGHWNGSFNRQQFIQLENIDIHLTIDFKESVLGCKKEVKYSRDVKCQECSGAGEVPINNGCQQCGGKGKTTVKQKGMIFISVCPKCAGKTSTENCKVCSGECFVHADMSVHVSVPPGILDGNTLRLQGMGNYAGTIMGIMDQYTDVFCHIKVKPEDGLHIEGRNVVSTLTISLLDAVKGCNRNVKTIFGEKEVVVKPQSRNRDEVIIPHCGVEGSGNQRVILDVQYPKNTDKLIGALTDEVV